MTPFHAVNGTAEDTSLGSNRVDFITTAQAFHWLDPLPHSVHHMIF